MFVGYIGVFKKEVTKIFQNLPLKIIITDKIRKPLKIIITDKIRKHRTKKNESMRLPGVEPGSIAWKAIILTVGLQTLDLS